MTAAEIRRNPYTDQERRQLQLWHEKAKRTRATSAPEAEERKAGDRFAQFIATRRDSVQPRYTWRELAEPLGINPQTLNVYLVRRKLTPSLPPSRRAYQSKPTRARYRTETHFPCGIHQITEENSYPPHTPGGPPRCKACAKAAQRRYYQKTKDKQKAARDARKASLGQTLEHFGGDNTRPS